MSTTYMCRKSWNKNVVGRTLKVVINNFKRDGVFLFNKAVAFPDTKIVMKMTSLGCPVQYEGKVNGFNAYYRDRWGEWYFEVYKGKAFESEVIFKREGHSDVGIGLDGMLFAEGKIMKYAPVFVRKHFGVVEDK